MIFLPRRDSAAKKVADLNPSWCCCEEFAGSCVFLLAQMLRSILFKLMRG